MSGTLAKLSGSIVAAAATLFAASPAQAGCGAGAGAIALKYAETLALCSGGAPTSSASAHPVVAQPAAVAPVAAVIDQPASVAIPLAAARRTVQRRLAQGAPRGKGSLDALVTRTAAAYRIDPHLLASIVRAESAGRQNAVSHKGALGLMQVMPATARSMGVDDPKRLLADPALALATGARYLKHLQAKLGNNVPLVVAAYNAGPGAVMKAGMKVPRYRETQGYVGTIMQRYLTLRAPAAKGGAL